MAMEIAKSNTCLNCGLEIAGTNFCSNCGQENDCKVLSAGHFVRDILDEFLKYDAKLLNTLRNLLLRPGYLPNEYIAGRRVAFISPLRLFFIVSTVFFFAYYRFGYGQVLQAKDATSNTVFDLAYIPIVALFMKPLYGRTRRLFMEHLIFTAHVAAFTDLCVLPGIIVRSQWWFYFAVFIVSPVYLALALKAVYLDPLWKSAVKAGFLTVAQAGAYLFVDYCINSALSEGWQRAWVSLWRSIWH
jgi:hypothetical protein